MLATASRASARSIAVDFDWEGSMRSVLAFVAVGLMAFGLGCASTPPAAAPVFERQEVKGLGDPEVVVVNMASRPIKVTLSGTKSEVLTIDPKGTARAKMPVGSYHYRAETKGATPFDGDQEFSPDGRYTWSFHIIRKMPAAPEPLLGELRRTLDSGFLEAASFEGARIGEGDQRVPSGTKEDRGWTTYPSGWGVRVEKRRIVSFRFGRNVLSDLGLFDRADIEAAYGAPDEVIRTDDGKGIILGYSKRRAAFLLDEHGEAALLLMS
jgi:hypothetical protein